MVMRFVALLVLVLWAVSVVPGDHQWVAGNAMEPGLYVLAAPHTDQ